MMSFTQIAKGKALYRRFRNLSDSHARQVLEFIDDLEGHEPNEETVAALREAENIDSLTPCSDLRDMLRQCHTT
jgi:hypothetical protein